MFSFDSFWRLASLALVIRFSHAYLFDSSCDFMKSDLTSAIQQSFSLAEIAYDALDSRNPSTGQLPDSKEAALVSYMLGLPDRDRYKDVYFRYGAIKDAPLSQAFTGQKSEMDTSDVIIFCTTDRLKPLTDQQKSDLGSKYSPDDKWDEVMGAPLLLGSEVDECHNGPPPGKQTAMAAYVQHYKSSGLPSSMQLCPWYLARMQKAAIKQLKQVQDWKGVVKNQQKNFVSSLFGRARNAVYGANTKLTTIDAYNLMDVLLLHELTHCRGAVGTPGLTAPTTDVKPEPYGWSNCRKIADSGLGNTNADNLAYLALSLYINGVGVTVQADGSFA